MSRYWCNALDIVIIVVEQWNISDNINNNSVVILDVLFVISDSEE